MLGMGGLIRLKRSGQSVSDVHSKFAKSAIDNHRAIGREAYLYDCRSVCQQRARPLLFRACGCESAG